MTHPGTAVTEPLSGLTSAQVAQRVAAGEVNDVPARTSRSMSEIVRSNVLTPFNAIIGALFVIELAVGPIQDALFGFVIVANSAIGILQEWRAKQTLDSLAVVGEARPRVLRDGAEQEIEAGQIVLGDVIVLGPGDRVVVDGKVVRADALEVDESLLTGESDSVLKHGRDAVMSGSFVVAGSGAFEATKVGHEAYAAKLAEEAQKFTLVNSELRSGINNILKYMTWLMIPAGILQVVTQLHRAGGVKSGISRSIAGLVPMVPEGLVLLTSVAFAVGVIRLGQKNCLVQELPAIEGLARVDTVCLDKTGTLTEGGMAFDEIQELPGAAGAGADVPTVLAALGAAEERPNATMQAVIERFPDPVAGWTPAQIAPFSSARKWSGVTFADGKGSWLLGAPDVLGRGTPAADEAEKLGATGLRVLMLARADGPVDAVVDGSIAPVALITLRQRIRSDARSTLDYFEKQNVALKVISGDNAVSVGAVAASLKLPGAADPMDARTLPEGQANADAFAEDVAAHSVFGRVTPQQKREMVKALQSRGHTVAMTGDGVNDVLALKDADIGVAMGSGAGATKAVAQIVLLDDRFATLPEVVAEGRRVIGNIERVANLFLVKSVYSFVLVILVGVFQLEYPFLPRHTTLIAALTIGIPAFFLALAPNYERARPGFVRRVLRFAIPAGLVAGIEVFVAYWVARGESDTLGEAQTTAMVSLFACSLYIVQLVARPIVWWKIVLIASMALLFVLCVAVPYGRHFFDLHFGPWYQWTTGLVIAAVACVALEVLWRYLSAHSTAAAAARAAEAE
ncbi:HAD-IC family P-type ATPase [Catenulispora sp. NF23]|uniref:HAD-IC family P-type ATPase n=1 Tax=Catenulispora pinistramenti TaxID=2705254 RepID=A0ABS5KJZ1_9ACTN|nr:HAD-IC family P-type ATPase [Catenulispora pinistramenti]MBS2532851.1 HAD-IC family P-type ATPase [Catenulispora pinistramenti]MBS2546335.1 HAD-IC family P-type ATPase [Catenulispora pinistramenti]